MDETPRQPDVRLVLRRPAESDDEADRRLRAALKRLLRDYRLRVVDMGTVKSEPTQTTERY